MENLSISVTLDSVFKANFVLGHRFYCICTIKYELATSLSLFKYPYDSKNIHKPSLELLNEK